MCLNCVIICGFISLTYVPQYTYNVPQFWQNNHIFFKISGILKVKSQVLGMVVIFFFSKQQNNTNYKLQWSGREGKKISTKMDLTKKH